MNRIHAVVWNTRLCQWSVVAETARRQGRASTVARVVAGGALLGALLAAPAAWGQAAPSVTVSSGNTNAYVAGNGVTVVNIDKSNAAGLSHNRYLQFNVDPRGLVLNNGDSSQMARQSQLAGQVMANMNLAAPARVILNEVVSNNRSTLAGFTEVLGARADVVLANPYGITCSGCGFISTDRVTLTTGLPFVKADGTLGGFEVGGGDILVNGTGLNATAQQILDLVTRSVRLDGPLNGLDVGITTGTNQWDYSARRVTGASTATGSVPGYSIDSSALGGMYAGRIKLTSTEAGVGVRMLADAAASAEDFTLSAAGAVEMQARISAQRHLAVDTSSTAAQALALTGASLTSGQDLALRAQAGGVVLAGGALVAGRDLSVDAAALMDAAGAAGLADANRRHAGGSLVLAVAGDASLGGTTWDAAGAWNGSFGQLALGSGTQLAAGGSLRAAALGDLDLGAAALLATGDLALTSGGVLSTAAAAGQGVRSTTGSVALTSSGGLANAGGVSADTGAAVLRSGGAFSNSGQVHAGTALDIADAGGGATQAVSNSGQLLADGALAIRAAALVNAAGGWVQGSSGSALTAASLDNAGTLLLSQQATAIDHVTVAGTLTNTGRLQSAGVATLTAAGIDNRGTVLSAGDLSATSSGAFANTGATAVVQAARQLTIGAHGMTNEGVLRGGSLALDSTSGLANAGTIDADSGAAALRVDGTLNNSGQVHAATALAVSDTLGAGAVQLANSGRLLADGTLALQAADLSNTAGGHIQARQGSAISAGALGNAGTWLLSDQAGAADQVTVSGLLTNSAVLQSGGDLALGAAQLANSGTLLARRTLAVTSTNFTNAAGGTAKGDRLVLASASLSNSGTVEGGSSAASTVDVTGTLANQAGGLLNLSTAATGGGTVTTGTLANAGTIQSNGALVLALGDGGLGGSGTVQAGTDLTLDLRAGASGYTASVGADGRLLAGGTLRMRGNAATVLDVAGTALVEGATGLDIAIGSVVLRDNGVLKSAGDLTLALDNLAMGGSQSRVLAATGGSGAGRVTLAQAFTHTGALFSGQDLMLSAPSITNGSAGGMVALRDLSVEATTGNLTNSGALYAGRDLSARAASGTLANTALANGSYQGSINAVGVVRLDAATLVNNSSISGTDVTIGAAQLHNEIVGGDTRLWGAPSARSTVQTGYTSKGYNGCKCVDQTEIWYYRDTWTQDQYYASGKPVNKPQIVASGTVRLNFNTAQNLGGVIAGQDIILTGTGSSPSFTNDDLSLRRNTYTQTYEHYIEYIAAGPAKYTDDSFHNASAITTSPSTIDSIGAGVHARGSLDAGGFALVNNSSPYTAAPVPTAPSASPAPAGTALQAASGVTPTAASAYLGGNAAAGVSGLQFGGITLVLPANPNGYFVVAPSPQSRYLVETNPMYQVGSTTVGSDYLAKLLGYSPDLLGRRLGDDSYEAYLVRQQLIAQTGHAVLASYLNAGTQMQGLLDSAAGESRALGLRYGKALTPEQQAGLQSDIVWMVATEVNGQVVLAPVVYLAPQTRAQVMQGAVITASAADFNLASLTNTGGTISGGKSLTIVSEGDVANLSGTLRGGDVRVTSTEGSILNQTVSTGSGDDRLYRTTIGKNAGIESTGSLSLDAKKDITNIGATMTAGTDASLKAGGDVTFDTIENRNTDTTHQAYDQGGLKGSTQTTTTTVQQVKSGLAVGGSLQVDAGRDITLAGTDARVGGDADLKAGGDLNIVARENSTTTHSETKAGGLAQGGAISSTIESKTDSLSVRNVGSTLQVGGNANLTAKNDITLQGSDVDVKGSGSVNATNVNVLAGRNYDETTTTTTSTAIGKVMDSGSSGAARSGSKIASSSKDGKAQASAEGSAEAGHKASGGVALYTRTETTSKDTDLRHVGSNLNFGGDLTVDARNDLTLQGSTVSGGGNVAVNATNVNLLAAEDKKTSTTTSSTTSVGFMGSTENKSDAGAGASASAYGGKGTPNAKAGASGEANASTENKLALYKGSKSSESTVDTTHQGSAIKSGGAMTIDASNNLTVQGSDLASGGDMALNAGDMRFEAVHDTHTTTRSSESTSVGLYATGSANASAGGSANAGIGAMAGGSASAGAKGEAGLYGEHNKSGSVEGSTTARTSGITSGGNLSRTATNGITDVGTRADVKGDLTQSAQTITSLAAADTTFSSSSSEDIGVRVGAYGEAGVTAQAQAGLSPKPGGQAFVAPGYGAGIRASAEYGKETDSSRSSTAVVSSFKVGGNVTSTSTGATKMEGTRIEAGQNVALNAGSLEYTAARDTSSSSSNKVTGGGSVGVDLVNKSASVSGQGGNESSRESSSTAVVGGIKAGGGISVTTQGDTRFEGTQIESGGATAVKAGGSLRFDAAKDTSESSSSGVNASADITAGKKEGSGNVAVGYEKDSASSSKDVVASIKSGGGITTESGGDTTLVGTTIAAQGDVDVKAGGNLKVEAAHETRTENGMHVDASGGGGKQGVSGKKYASTGEANVGGGFKKSNSDTATGASISSGGGKVNLSSGKDTTLVGTQVQAKGQTTVTAGGTVTQKAAVSTSSSSSAEVSASASGGSMQPVKKKGASATPPAGGKKKKNAPVGSGILEVETTNESTTSSQEVSLAGGQGVVVSQGGNSAKPQVKAAVNLPTEGRKSGRGAAIVAKTADGKPLPSWLKFDPKTGVFTGTPPAGYEGDLKVKVFIPMADGTIQTRAVSFGK